MRKLILFSLCVLAAFTLSSPAFAVGPNVITGYVADDQGNPLTGANVYLFDAPDTETSDEVTPRGTDVSGPDGEFSISLPITSAYLSQASANGGQVNFEVVADVGTAAVTSEGFSRQPDAAANAWLAENFTGTEVASFAAGAPSSPMENASEVPVFLKLPGQAGPTQAAVPPPQCGVRRTALASTNVLGVIGQLHLGKDQTASFTYGRVADSDIGIGFSANGTNWSIKGSAHVGNSEQSSIRFNVSTLNTTATFGKKARSSFRATKYRHQRVCAGNVTATWYTIRGRRWRSGTAWGDSTAQYNNRCGDDFSQHAVSFLPNSEFHRARKNFAKYTLGIAVYGANLWTQSGASDWAHSDWRFGDDYGGYWLCGSNADPPDAGRIYAGH